MAFFIKRNEQVNGPFTEAQIKSDAANGKLKPADMIATSKEGPWSALSNYASVQNQESEPPEGGNSESAAEIIVDIYKELFKGSANAIRQGVREGIKQHEAGQKNEVAEELVGGAADLMKGMARAFRQGINKGIKQHEQEDEPSEPATTPTPEASRTNTCSDCGGLVSVQASTCPHCGAPTDSVSAEDNDSDDSTDSSD